MVKILIEYNYPKRFSITIRKINFIEMGIKNISKVIGDNASKSVKEFEFKSLFGRKVAIDATMCLYQFLIAIRPDNYNGLTSESGETTSHIQGLFYRTIRMLSNGIKPVYVFDGTPPELKASELESRSKKREEAKNKLDQDIDEEEKQKLIKRTVKITPQQKEDAMKLLNLMGVPVIDAPGEAEAQCSYMAMEKIVYAVGSEDMDTLTFGSPILLRHLLAAESKKLKIKEFNLKKILEEFEMSMESFIDLCILLGCDYCGTIRGIGQKKAFELIKKYGNIETIIKNIDVKKFPIPENFNYKAAREEFKNPKVEKNIGPLKWNAPDEEGLKNFLLEKGFNIDRINSGIKKLKSIKKAPTQNRITDFFDGKQPPAKRFKTIHIDQ